MNENSSNDKGDTPSLNGISNNNFEQELVLLKEKYKIFSTEIDTLPEYESLRKNQDVLNAVKRLHPHNHNLAKSDSANRLESIINADSSVRTSIAPALSRMLDDGEEHDTLNVIKKLKITGVLSKLKSIFRNPEKKNVRARVVYTLSIFPYEEIRDIIDDGLLDPDVTSATLFVMRSLDLPKDMINKIWQRFEVDKNIDDKFFGEGGILARKDPERYAGKLTEMIDQSFQIVGPDELEPGGRSGLYERKISANMSKEEFKRKNEVQVDRYEMLRSIGLCFEDQNYPELLVRKLNEWLSIKVQPPEKSVILGALENNANLDTIHLITRRKFLSGENELPYWVLISKNYNKFNKDNELQKYLSKYAKDDRFATAVAAIRAGKKLIVTAPPHEFGSPGLAIEDNGKIDTN